MLHKKILAEIKKRVELATPGPWIVDNKGWAKFNDISVWVKPYTNPDGTQVVHSDLGSDILFNMGLPVSEVKENMQAWHDANFIAGTRQDMPLLLKSVQDMLNSVEHVVDDLAEAKVNGLTVEKLTENILRSLHWRFKDKKAEYCTSTDCDLLDVNKLLEARLKIHAEKKKEEDKRQAKHASKKKPKKA